MTGDLLVAYLRDTPVNVTLLNSVRLVQFTASRDTSVLVEMLFDPCDTDTARTLFGTPGLQSCWFCAQRHVIASKLQSGAVPRSPLRARLTRSSSRRLPETPVHVHNTKARTQTIKTGILKRMPVLPCPIKQPYNIWYMMKWKPLPNESSSLQNIHIAKSSAKSLENNACTNRNCSPFKAMYVNAQCMPEYHGWQRHRVVNLRFSVPTQRILEPASCVNHGSGE